MEERFLRTGAVQPARERRAHPFLRMVAKGLVRLALLLAAAAAITAALGLLIGWLRGDDLSKALAYAFYIGGILVFLLALFTGGRRVRHRGDLGEDLGEGGSGTINEGALMIFVAFFLLALGVLVESQT